MPSYREGLPKSLIEAAAIGRPIVTTDTIGCREAIRNKITGELVKLYDVEDLIDNEYVLDIILGVGIFIIIIFLILLINRAISKVVSYSGIGSIDKIFGFFFGIIKSYVIVVCLYTAAEIIYNHEKWPLNLDDSFTYPWVEKGSNYLIKEFPNEKEYEDAKEKIQDI